jgi:hypothetical protein
MTGRSARSSTSSETERQLWAVTEVDGAGLEGPLFFSPAIAYRGNGEDIELRSLAVTHNPASVGLGAIDAFAGSLAEAASRIVYQDGHAGVLVKRAHKYDRRRSYREPLVIQAHIRSGSPRRSSVRRRGSGSRSAPLPPSA